MANKQEQAQVQLSECLKRLIKHEQLLHAILADSLAFLEPPLKDWADKQDQVQKQANERHAKIAVSEFDDSDGGLQDDDDDQERHDDDELRNNDKD